MIDPDFISRDSLTPLPPIYRHGLIAIAVPAFLSFFATIGLGSFLAYRILWQRRRSQLAILIFNLMIADMKLSVGYLIEAHWLAIDMIEVGSPACSAQGWFLTVGQLSSAFFCLVIAAHTFTFVTYGYQLRKSRFYMLVALVWLAVYTSAVVGVAAHPRGWWARNSPWCWISNAYSSWRIWAHFFWIGLVEIACFILYGALFVILRIRIRSGHYDEIRAKKAATASKSMFIFPLTYIVCTLPLLGIPIVLSQGRSPSVAHLCAGAALFTSVGWLDVLTYSLTRRFESSSSRSQGSDIDPLDTFDPWWAYRRGDGRYGTTTTCEAIPPQGSRDHSTDGLVHPLPFMTMRKETTVKVASAPIELVEDPVMSQGDLSIKGHSSQRSGDMNFDEASLKGRGSLS